MAFYRTEMWVEGGGKEPRVDTFSTDWERQAFIAQVRKRIEKTLRLHFSKRKGGEALAIRCAN